MNADVILDESVNPVKVLGTGDVSVSQGCGLSSVELQAAPHIEELSVLAPNSSLDILQGGKDSSFARLPSVLGGGRRDRTAFQREPLLTPLHDAAVEYRHGRMAAVLQQPI
jgi:hypothetical protein